MSRVAVSDASCTDTHNAYKTIQLATLDMNILQSSHLPVKFAKAAQVQVGLSGRLLKSICDNKKLYFLWKLKLEVLYDSLKNSTELLRCSVRGT